MYRKWDPGVKSLFAGIFALLAAALALALPLQSSFAAQEQTWEQQCRTQGTAVFSVNGRATTLEQAVKDCATLMEIKDTLRGSATLNWTPSIHIANWDGVRVSDGGFLGGYGVDKIALSGKGLDGSIPSELGNLPKLFFLELQENNLTGSIPTELGNLKGLGDLRLYNNRLSGRIPKELGSATNLTNINLHDNQLSGRIPKELGNLPRLRWLDLHDNRLSGRIPAELGNNTHFQKMSLHNNRLSGCVPLSIRNLALPEHPPEALKKSLGLPWCSDKSLRASLERQCSTGGAVSDAANNPGLVKDCVALLLAKDALRGSVSLNWSAETRIERWQGIRVKGAPPRVTRISLSGLELDGKMLPYLGDLTNLTRLDLSENNLSGSIPGKLSNLSDLRQLHLNENRLGGGIPQSLGKLSNLRQLHLDYNRLNGSIPQSLGELSNLRRLHLDGNALSGCIPKSIRKLPLGKDAVNALPTDLRLKWCE